MALSLNKRFCFQALSHSVTLTSVLTSLHVARQKALAMAERELWHLVVIVSLTLYGQTALEAPDGFSVRPVYGYHSAKPQSEFLGPRHCGHRRCDFQTRSVTRSMRAQGGEARNGMIVKATAVTDSVGRRKIQAEDFVSPTRLPWCRGMYLPRRC